MRDGVKVLAGCLALMIGAAAPTGIIAFVSPGSLILSNSPPPSSGERHGIQQSRPSSEHRDTQPAEQAPENSPITQHPRDDSTIRAKAQGESQWNTPEGWTAIFTGLLFIATTGLWIFTWLLWASTRKAIRDEEKALQIAQFSANAARDSADALPTLERAHVFIDVSPSIVNEMQETIRGFRDAIGVRYHFINHGKTPAIIKTRSVAVFPSSTPEKFIFVQKRTDAEEIIPSGGTVPPIVHRQVFIDRDGNKADITETYRLEERYICSLTIDERNAIENGETFIWFRGYIVYSDIFGKEHETGFCWRFDGTKFSPYGKEYNYRK